MLSWFVRYLEVEKNCSAWTVTHYSKDIEQLFTYLSTHTTKHLEELVHQDVRYFVSHLVDEGYSKRTIARKLSSLRSFGKFLEREEFLTINPFFYMRILLNRIRSYLASYTKRKWIIG